MLFVSPFCNETTNHHTSGKTIRENCYVGFDVEFSWNVGHSTLLANYYEEEREMKKPARLIPVFACFFLLSLFITEFTRPVVSATHLPLHDQIKNEQATQGVSSALVRFAPVAILNDSFSSTRLEVYGGNNVSSVQLQLDAPLIVDGFLGCNGPITIDLYDDGTHGDLLALDFVFTIGDIVWEQEPGWPSCPVGSYVDSEIEGVRKFFIGDVLIHNSGGGEYNFDNYQYFLNVLDQSVFTKADSVVTLTDDVQVSSNVINIVDDDYRVEGFLGRWGNNFDLRPLTQRLYEVTPDNYEFLNLISTVYLDCVGGCASGVHDSVQVDWVGTGQGIYNNSVDYGSGGTLLGINAMEAQSYDSYNLLIHETMHQWGAYLDEALGLNIWPHWLSNTSVGGALGGCVWEDNGDGSFTSLGHWGNTRIAPPLELYLLGLAEPDEVVPLYRAENTGQSFCQVGTHITGPFQQVTIDDIIAYEGLRIPGPPNARTNYRMAVVVTSQNSLLTPLEMTLYNKAAQLIEGTIAGQGDYLTFSEYTDGRATLLTSLGNQISPTLQVTPTTLSFQNALIDPETQSLPISITNTGFGKLHWTAAKSSDGWFTMEPASGTAPSTISVTVNATGLASGTYVGNIIIDGGNNTQNSPETVTVTLSIPNRLYVPLIMKH